MRTILFDVDGTLVDSVALHARAWQEVFARYGRRVARADVAHYIGMGGDQLVRRFLSAQEIRRFGKRLREERDRHFQTHYLSRVKPFPHVRALFQRLKQDGFAILLGSSGKTREIRHYMRLLKVESLVDTFTTSEDADASKPHPDIFEAALRKAGRPPARDVLVIGDSPYDAQAATRAGLTSIGVLCGGFTRRELQRAGCANVFRDPADLLDRYAYSPWPWMQRVSGYQSNGG